ncbi:MAG: Tn3 family transposase [Desulfobacterales bacterium]|nr:MAG: Tn3 family transposase [Desulfobacterales bacterium]
MKTNWTTEDLAASWLVLPEDQKLIGKKQGVTRLGFALMLKFFQFKGRFPSGSHSIPMEAVQFVAQQVRIDPGTWKDYPWQGRSWERHRASIRKHLGFREATISDAEALQAWLVAEILEVETRMDRLKETVLERCRKLLIEPPADEQIRRLIVSALQEHETRFCKDILQSLACAVLKRMDALLEVKPSEEDEAEGTAWQSLKADPGKAGLNSVKQAAFRLKLVRQIGLPVDFFKSVSPKLAERYAKRAAVEEPFELRRHAKPLRATLLAAYLQRRSEELTDHLVDLLVETIHKMGKKAEARIEASEDETIQKASGKLKKLYRMAKACVHTPKGTVEEVIFPEASEKWLRTFIREVERGAVYNKGKVRASLQRSYRFHYRRMLPELLNVLELRCTNAKHQPVLQALKIIRSNLKCKGRTYPKAVQVPLKGVVSADWLPLVVESEGKPFKINRVAYEICVLKALRERLRCREIWVIGSRRYRDPEEDLPQDFEERKASYYADLGVALDPKAFTAALREEVTRHLRMLDSQMPSDSKVRIVRNKNGSRILISPFKPQADPENLALLKQELNFRWAGTSLLDVLKETDLRVNFTHCLKSGTERFHMDKAALRRRLLLCLYGLGTNTEIKSMESRPADDYKDLLYIRRRFISIEGLRQAISKVVDATLAVRLPRIWGEATTSCASDSKQFGAWDQNLLTEWHLRYGGRGVMV